MPINQQDFVTPLTGNIVVLNNGYRFVLQANADLNTLFEGDETFRFILRKGSNTGPIVAQTDVLIVRDTSNTITYNSLIESGDTIAEGQSISFVLSTTNLGPNNILYYNTVGNAASSLFATGNTGSFITTGNAYTLTLTTTQTIPDNETRNFRLQIKDSPTGAAKITSNVINVVDSLQAFITATGGNVFIGGGYKTHVFHSSNTFTITSLGIPANRTVEYVLIAGGGGGSAGFVGGISGGGGAGGMLFGSLSNLTTQSYTMTIGGGGGGGSPYNPGVPASVLNGGSGNPSSAFNSMVSIPGGGGSSRTGDSAGSSGNGFGGGPFNTGDGSFGIGGGGAGEAGKGPTGPNYGTGGNGLPITWLEAAIPASAIPAYGELGPGPYRWFAGGGGTLTRPGGIGQSSYGGGGNSGGQPGKNGMIFVRYPYTVETYRLTEDTAAVVRNSNLTINLQTINVSNGSTLYYTISGNVIGSDFVSNTGSFVLINSNANITLSVANTSFPTNKDFFVNIRKNSISGTIVVTSNTTIILNDNVLFATGGTTALINNYRIHTFTTSSNLNVLQGTGNVEYLVVGGGGGGGGNPGGPAAQGAIGVGGGGAGGLIYQTKLITPQVYTVLVGAGGGNQTKGSNSSVFGNIAVGGGNGAGANPGSVAASSGGSGGGGGESPQWYYQGNNPIYFNGAANVIGQGYPGGTGSLFYGGGGGGRSQSGYPGDHGSPTTAKGGAGVYLTISGSNVAYAGGGGGSARETPAPGVTGSIGGGGGSGESGTAYTGGGGGAGLMSAGGRSGGSGIVIIRYPIV